MLCSTHWRNAMKKTLIIPILSLVLFACSSSTTERKERPDFDWMPEPSQWEQNIRNCRSQPQCNPADLFNRTGYVNTIG